MTTASDSDFLGRGWAFPLRIDAAGSFVLSGGADDISEAIRLILGTAYGERPMRPEYGCAIHDLIFDSVDPALCGRISADVRQALIRWEPRIEVLSVISAPHPVEQQVLLVDIGYRIRATNDRRNLVFPFYSIPQE